MTFKPRLRTIFLIVNLIVLLIPLGGIGVLRIYESQLIRRTESQLISQGALVRAVYRDRLRRAVEAGKCGQMADLSSYGRPVEVDWPVNIEDKFTPIPADLELASDPVYPVAPNPVSVESAAEPCAEFVGKHFIDTLLDAQRITLSGIHVVDPGGTVIATTQHSLGKSIINRAEVRDALDGHFVRVMRQRTVKSETWSLESIQRRTSVRVFVAMPIVADGRLLGAVVLVRTPMSLVKSVYNNRIIFGAFIGVIVLAAVFISLLAAVFIGRPIGRLVEQTRRIADDEADATDPIEHAGTREISDLSVAFADMAAALDERADYIRTFARNVSHEFKTPISSIQGTVELLEDHLETMSEEQRHKFLAMLDADAHRMEKLVDRLLELARADMLQPDDAAVDVGATLAEIAERADQLDVVVVNADRVGAAAMAAETFGSIVSNLLENARQHGAGRVDIDVAGRRVDGQSMVEIVVRDDGPGISAGNADKIFEAFFTTHRAEGGTGLGLAIVRSLMRAHDGDIELVDSDPDPGPDTDGAAFRLTLPEASGQTR